MRSLLRPLAAALTCLLAFTMPARATTFPEKAIRFIVPNTPGSATDQLARVIALTVQQSGGTPVVVDNKPGANGILAAEAVARSPADGYTVLIGNSTTNAANPSLYKKLPYDAGKDFAPISGLGRGSQVLVVNNDIPVKTVAELIALAKANLTDADPEGRRHRYYNDQWHHAMARIAAACRAYGLRPVDGPYTNFRDEQGFKASAARARSLGFDGKWAIHPHQVDWANEVFTPSETVVAWAEKVSAAMRDAAAKWQGAISIDGELVDLAHLKMTHNILERSRAIQARNNAA